MFFEFSSLLCRPGSALGNTGSPLAGSCWQLRRRMDHGPLSAETRSTFADSESALSLASNFSGRTTRPVDSCGTARSTTRPQVSWLTRSLSLDSSPRVLITLGTCLVSHEVGCNPTTSSSSLDDGVERRHVLCAESDAPWRRRVEHLDGVLRTRAFGSDRHAVTQIPLQGHLRRCEPTRLRDACASTRARHTLSG